MDAHMPCELCFGYYDNALVSSENSKFSNIQSIKSFENALKSLFNRLKFNISKLKCLFFMINNFKR